MCKKFVIFLSVLLLASFSLWAFPGRVTGSQETRPIGTSVPEVPEGEQRTDSGTTPESISAEPKRSLADEETVAKAAEGRRLSGDEAAALYDELVTIEGNMASLREVSREKDEVIDGLARENARLKDETGTKAYMLIDGIVGFSEGDPDYGLGLTVGTRLGNSLMLELGTDYMIGSSLSDILDFSIDDFTFRAGVGWLF